MKKKNSILEALKEDVGYTPEKAKQIIADAEKALPMIKEQAKNLYNMFTAVTIGDLLEHGREEMKKYEKGVGFLDKKISAFKTALEDISSDMYDQSEKELSKEARDLEGDYYELYNQVDSLRSVIDQLDTTMMDWDDDIEKNLKKFS